MLRRKLVGFVSIAGAVLMLVAGDAGCAERAADATAGAPPSPKSSALLAVRNARVPMDGVLSGGQPTPEQIQAAADAGFRTVINLRTPEEPGFEWEPDEVRRLDMHYESIPVVGARGLTRENVERVDARLKAALDEGPVLLHCASGNRVGAVLALREAWLHGADPEAAVHYGLDSGMTRLEVATRELLEVPADAQ